MKNNKLESALRNIYSHDLEYQIERYQCLIKFFKCTYPQQKNFRIFRAPGRVNIIGEHTDYNGLPVMPMTLDRDIVVIAAPGSDSMVNVRNIDVTFGERSFTIKKTIEHYQPGDWGNYLKASAQALVNIKDSLKGMDCVIGGDVPQGSGLSSSSALVVSIGITLGYLNRMNMPKLRLAELFAEGERYVGLRGGGMDQTISLMGRAGSALKIDFFPLKVSYAKLPEDKYSIIVCNSLKAAEKSGKMKDKYNEKSLSCKLAAAIMNKKLDEEFGKNYRINLPGDLRQEKFDFLTRNIDKLVRKYFPKIIYSIEEIACILGENREKVINRYLKLKDGTVLGNIRDGFKLRSRVLHILTEWKRVEKSVMLMKSGKWKEFGALMYQSHESCRDNYEISCPELEKLVGLAKEFGATGARLTGAGFGGCTVNLIRKGKEAEFMDFIKEKYYNKYLNIDFKDTYMNICHSTPGAGYVLSDRITGF